VTSIKFQLPKELRDKISRRAAKQSRSEASIIREALYLYFQRRT